MRQVFLTILILVAFTLAGADAAAQDEPSRIETSAGYQFLYAWAGGDAEGHERFEKGWYGDAAVRLNRPLAAVIHVAGNYKTIHTGFTNEGLVVDNAIQMKLLQMAGGIRVNVRPAEGVVTPFGQVLIGAFRVSGKGTATGTIGDQTITVNSEDSETKPMTQLGGGVNIRVSKRLGIRGGVDYLHVFGDVLGSDGGLNGLRAGVGAVVGF